MPVPFPCTILIVGMPAKTQLSKYLSIACVASSTVKPITFISVVAFFALKSSTFLKLTFEFKLLLLFKLFTPKFELAFACALLFDEVKLH